MASAFVTGAVLPRSGLSAGATAVCADPARFATGTTYAPLEIYAAKHAQLKAAKKSNRLRPKKHRPSDINRAAPKYHPEPHLVNGPAPFYTVLSTEEVAALEVQLASADPTTLITEEDVKAFDAAQAEKEAKEAATLAEKRRVSKEISKVDKVTAKQAKMAAHRAHKLAREEAVAAMRAALAISEAEEASASEEPSDESTAPEDAPAAE